MSDLRLHSKKPGVAIITSANPLDNLEIHRIARSEWQESPDNPGVYLLYGNPDGQLTAYVGMSTTSIRKRIRSHHVNKKKNWFGVLFAMPLPLATIC
jgi:hypothetical protein